MALIQLQISIKTFFVQNMMKNDSKTLRYLSFFYIEPLTYFRFELIQPSDRLLSYYLKAA
jgi:hypothetical protein